ncbi:MAG TPA: uracil-DNA glycosylase [Kofleriaceae bacterium]|nr:uracil-DNA glycosylase [Kofleriaceae bacterium]
MSRDSLERIDREIAACARCPRLVAWRQEAAVQAPRRFRGEEYWGRPVPGFGDPRARLLVLGLAPAANGANRTGRVFTGDRSGDWLYRALHRGGFASQPTSVDREDGLRLRDCRVAVAVRCAPPDNRPSIEERDECQAFLIRELRALERVRVILALGSFAWDAALRAARELGQPVPAPRPRFGHAAEAALGRYALVGSFHPSQQNTFTGRLTEADLDRVVERARVLLAE